MSMHIGHIGHIEGFETQKRKTHRCSVSERSCVDKPLLAGSNDDWLLGPPIIRVAVLVLSSMQQVIG